MRTDVLSRADWLDSGRVTAYARILACLFGIAVVAWIGLSPHLIDPAGKPLGTDFMDVWAAGKLALSGEPAGAYDYARHSAVQRQALPWPPGADIPYFGWHYPPMFLLVAAPLALLPYGVALAAWMALTLPIYVATMREILQFRRWLLFALAFPAVFINLGHGQNGFLTAGLLGGGLPLLERRPVVAGILFGCLSYKPQFGLLLPMALIAGRHWRAFIAAGVTTIGIAALSYAVLGASTWQAFLDSMPLTRGYILEQGATGWQKIQSVFAAVRMLGGGIEAAYFAQGICTTVMALAVVQLWRRPAAMPLKAAALATASLIATPYVLDYDLIVLALPIGWLAIAGIRHGFLPWEKIVLLAAFLLPLVSRSIGSLGAPIAPLVLAALFVLILRRAGWNASFAPRPAEASI